MAEIPKISNELLLRAFSRPSLGSAIQSGVEGFKTGVDIGGTLADRKSKQKKEELELMKEIQKLAAQQKLIKEAQTPVSIDKPGKMQTAQAVEQPSGEFLAPPVVPTKEVQAPLSFGIRTPLSKEETASETLAKEERMKGYAAEAEPDTFAKSLLKDEDTSGIKRYQTGTAEVNGKMMNIMFDQIKGEYLNSDRTPIKGENVRGFKADIRVDPVTEQLLRITSGGVQTPIGGVGVKSDSLIEFPEDLTVRQSNRLNEQSKLFATDDVVNTARNSLATIQNLETVQAQGTGALIGTLQSLRARGLAGEKGVLTEKDVERTTGSPQALRRLSNAMSKLLSGKENPENIAEFNAALSAVKQANLNRIAEVGEQYVERARATKELSNVSPALIKKNISIGTQSFDVGPVVPPQYPGKAKTTKSGISYEVE
jgi:uncharacterized protein YifE (UPF0438 family)